MKAHTIRIIFISSLVVLSTPISTPAFAQPKSADPIKFRQSAMMFMRWNVGTIKKQVIKNPQSYNRKQVSAAANAIAAVANTNLLALFRPGTETGVGWKETLVKPGLFERPDDAKLYLANLRKEADELARVADSGDVDMIKPQFSKLFQACRACHKNFRKKP